ncbi:FHIPEP family type III secretion protein [Buchnera aphidicola]|uniref:flagellar biosynthesis protein FlhA n=1 Tax=Buchnera aphidicola TaxID=9 RepID=UPI0030EF0341
MKNFYLNFKNNISDINWKIFFGPILILMILLMMIFPLNPILLDFFFTFNIVISIIVLLVSMFIKKILNFTAFPSILLFTTLLRLSLNIASAKVILMSGHNGYFSAGHVIESFGNFLVGGNFSIGIIVFIILVIINFIVITKGSMRIAEVSARFALDGMPLKQMSVDSDLNTGLIKQKIAKKRRLEIFQESDFYGSMDGASKFVRGDAIAGILIMFVNIIGGLIIGVTTHQMNIYKAIKLYTLLTIGDGLVAQIPSLLISTAAGIIVSRVETNKNVSDQIFNQLFFNNPNLILLSSIIIGFFGFLPGMPNIIFLLFSFFLFIFFQWLKSKKNILKKNNKKKKFIDKNKKISWKDIRLEDTLRLELSFNLIKHFKKNNYGLLEKKIFFIRKRFSEDIGFLPPLIKIKKNINLLKNNYKIFLKGLEIANGIVYINKFIAIRNNKNNKKISGIPAKEPIFHMKSYWIDLKNYKKAIFYGYTVIDSISVIITHLDYIISISLYKLFGLYETQQMLNKINDYIPEIIENLSPNNLSLKIICKILKNLLFENVPIKDMQTILETLIEYSYNKKHDIEFLTSKVRLSLKKIIVQKLIHNNKVLYAVGMDCSLEKIFLRCLKKKIVIDSKILHLLFNEIYKYMKKKSLKFNSHILIVNDKLRFFLAKILKKKIFNLHILSYKEIPSFIKIKIFHYIKQDIN